MPSISIVIPTIGRPNLAKTVESVQQIDYERSRLQVVVVDDSRGGGSAKETVEAACASGIDIARVELGGRGAAAARNRGAREADGDLLLFCDDDVILPRDHLQRHAEVQRRFERSVVGGVSEFAPEVVARLRSTPFGRYRIKLEEGYESQANETRVDEDCFATSVVSARNLAVQRDLFWEIGGFDKGFPYAGAEDQALSFEARRAGCRLLRCTHLKVLNNESILTLRQFCEREQRSAESFVVLVERFPDQRERPLFAANVMSFKGDRPAAISKKAGKSLLSRPRALRTLHRLVETLEGRHAAESLLERAYSLMIGLHVFRGIQNGLRLVGR